MELGGSEIDPKTKWMIPWYKAKYKGAAKIICTNNSSGRPVFEVVSGSCKTEEPNFVASPKVGASTPSLCYASPVAQQAYGKGACAVYRQNASLDMPLKVIFFNNGIRKYPNPGEYAESFEQVYSATQGRLFTSAGVSITYKGETKNLNTFCGDYTATAKNNSTCSKSSSVVIGGVTFKIGVGARNTIDPKGYVPNYISGLPNSTKTEVWSQKTCGVVTLSSSLGYLPPPCP
jgi:hypothetical protein